MTIIFGRTQNALETPFEPNRNPGFGGTPSEIESNNVQDAIEEAKNDALNNDRYIILCSYGGNANAGRTLEAFPGITMIEAPIYLPVSSKLLTTIVGATANGTATVGFFNRAVSTTVPVFSVTLTAQRRRIIVAPPALPLAVFPAGAELEVRVTSGSLSKPHVYFFLSAAT